MWPVTIVKTRYSGIYEGGQWAAFNQHTEDIPAAAMGSDMTCAAWWEYASQGVGVGPDPNSALADLINKKKETQ